MGILPNELRIGNLIQLGKKIVTVEHNEIKFISEVEGHAYKGIPLTPEWLERAGFEKWDWHDGYIIPFMGKHLMIRKYQGRILTTTVRVQRDLRGHLGKDSTEFLKPDQLLYVHQLQNLYFAFWGQELTIKEPETTS